MLTKTKSKSRQVKYKVNKPNGKVKYPYITKNAGISGGDAIIKGTRVSVRVIAGYYQLGMTVDEILASLKHLTPSQVHSALAYYFDHQREIDKQIALNNEILSRKKSSNG
jgi:uncharacterized protein (DUF433 family)